MDVLAPTLRRRTIAPKGCGTATVRSTRATRSRSAIVFGLVTLFALQLGFGFYAEQNPKRKDPPFGDKFAKLTTRPSDQPLVLMLGTSRTLLGFQAGQVEEECPGVRAFNFGTPSSGPITHLVYLHRLLNAGIVPDLLIVEVLPSALTDGAEGPIEQSFFTGERLSESEVDLVTRFGFPRHKVRSAWRESIYSPLSALRFQIVSGYFPSWIPWQLRWDWSRNTDPHGWATPPRPVATTEERRERTANAEMEYRGTLAQMTPEGRPLLALEELLKLGRAHGIRTRIIIMPEAPSFQKLYPPGLSDRIAELLERTAHRHGSSLIDARHWLTEEDCYDGHHMFRHGAERFTRRLTDEVIRPIFNGVSGGKP